MTNREITELWSCNKQTNALSLRSTKRTQQTGRNFTDRPVAVVTPLSATHIHGVNAAFTFLATVYSRHTGAMTHTVYSHRHSNSQLLSGARCRPQREIDWRRHQATHVTAHCRTKGTVCCGNPPLKVNTTHHTIPSLPATHSPAANRLIQQPHQHRAASPHSRPLTNTLTPVITAFLLQHSTPRLPTLQ